MTDDERLEQFTRECKLINLRYEYTGYTNDIQWAIVTELSEEEILQKYPEEIKQYIPFIKLSVSQGEVFEESKRYENKYRMRMILKCRLNRRSRAMLSEIMIKFSKANVKGLNLSVDLNPSNI